MVHVNRWWETGIILRLLAGALDLDGHLREKGIFSGADLGLFIAPSPRLLSGGKRSAGRH